MNIFQGERIVLRAGEPSESVLFRNWDRQDTEHNRLIYTIGFPEPQTEAPAGETSTTHEGGDNFPFTIATLDGAVAGAIHVHHCNVRCGTFMYGIGIFPEHQHKGYASEAISLVLRYYFDERRYQKCTAEVYSFNEASIKLHERLGFTLEGRLRRMVYTGGSFHDSLFYGITHEEFRDRNRLNT